MRKIFEVVALEDKATADEPSGAKWLGMCLTPVPIVKYDGAGGFAGLFIGTLPPVEGADKYSALRNVEYQITQHFESLRNTFSEIEFDKIMVGV
jgi:hypothetical protein